MKRFFNYNKHLKIFLGISILIFIMDLIFNTLIAFGLVEMKVNGVVFPSCAGAIIVFIAIMMIVMGVYYFGTINNKINKK